MKPQHAILQSYPHGSSQGNYKSTLDPGKAAPSGSDTGGYRRAGTAAGPQSSTAEYTSNLDPGKALPSASSGEYRRVGTASGPTSSTAHYTPTLDPGKALPSGNSGEYRRVGTAAGPQSSVAEYTPTLDPGISSSVSGGNSHTKEMNCQKCNFLNTLGGKFCSNCGNTLF